jgi:hypothetical protein
MTNDATRAKGEALPAMTRRTALAATGAALAAALSEVAASAAAPAAHAPSPAIAAAFEAAFEAVTATHRELLNARADRDWLADEWRHRWPRAPESAKWHSSDGTIETDIIGRVYRDAAGKPICLKPTEEMIRWRRWADYLDRPMRANASMKARQRRAEWRQNQLREIAQAESYFSEIQRLRAASGAAAALARVDAAERDLDAAIAALLSEPSRSLADLRVKACCAVIVIETSNVNATSFKAVPLFACGGALAADVLALVEG